MTKRLTPEEAAALLGLSVRTVQALCAAGRIDARKSGRDWRIKPGPDGVPVIRPPDRPVGRPTKRGVPCSGHKS